MRAYGESAVFRQTMGNGDPDAERARWASLSRRINLKDPAIAECGGKVGWAIIMLFDNEAQAKIFIECATGLDII
ncbi:MULTISPECIES: hypothetical protein [Pseudofrankia]|uniref:hypothetical protein n=1 Tax=Pseudofrankia TaxID=2994363 RepID=UPI000234C57E|nr:MULTISPECIES: hypothetical protein [Pseudofrankia]